MGLDMFLEKDIYVGAMYEYRKVTGRVQLKTEGESIKVNVSKIASITERVAYWRKANQIHNWFVKNVQEDVDNCARYYVSREQLEELVWVCKRVLDDKKNAHNLLPVQGGFFFGNTDYDEYYFEDIENTIKMLEDEFQSMPNPDVTYFYQASW